MATADAASRAPQHTRASPPAVRQWSSRRGPVLAEGLLYATTEPLRCDNRNFALLGGTRSSVFLSDGAQGRR